MAMPISSFSIDLENNPIHIYAGEYMIQGGTFTLRGHVILTTQRPLIIRQITMRFRGTVNNLISDEFARQDEPIPETEDVNHWPISALHNANCDKILSLKERMTRYALNSALGLASTTCVLADIATNLFRSATTTTLGSGTHRLAFELIVPYPANFAPSIVLPRHSVHYELSARLHLVSVVDIVAHVARQRRLSLSTVVPITVYCHRFGNLALLRSQPRTRYHGSRATMIDYGVTLAKYICMEDGILDIACNFRLLQSKAAVSFVQVALDQIITFALQGERLSEMRMEPDVSITKIHRIADVKYPVSIEIDQPTQLHFSLDIRSRFLIPDLTTVSLKGTHKVRLLVHFTDPHVREMSLSFPIIIGTALPNGDSALQIPAFPNHSSAHYEEERNSNEWVRLIANSNILDNAESTDDAVHIHDRPPTYSDVLLEGSPPSAFI